MGGAYDKGGKGDKEGVGVGLELALAYDKGGKGDKGVIPLICRFFADFPPGVQGSSPRRAPSRWDQGGFQACPLSVCPLCSLP